MAPRGKTPSLVGGGAGASKIVQPPGKRRCKHCHESIPPGEHCAEVAVPGTMGHKTYCIACFQKIISKSKEDLAKLETEVHGIL